MILFFLPLLAILVCAAPAFAQDDGSAAKPQVDFAIPAMPVTQLPPLVNPFQTYSYERMLADAETLQARYPRLVTVHDIGRSVFGRRIIAIQLGTGPVEITLNGAHHGREWITSALLMQMIDTYALAYCRGEYLDGYDVYDLLTRASIWVVPMVNPDGVALCQTGPASVPDPVAVLQLNGGRSDFSAWKANGRGVDLNRQYPAVWERIDQPAPAPGASNYKGSMPLTEPEVMALREFALAHEFRQHAAFHAAGEVIYWHFLQQGELYRRSWDIARRLHALTGYRPIPPQRDPSGGGYKDWVVQKLGAPAFTIEVGHRVSDGPVPLTDYPRIWSRMRAVGLLLAQEAVTPSASDGYLLGYLDGVPVMVGDCQHPLRVALQRLVHEGRGTRARIVEKATGKTRWSYPNGALCRVVVGGETISVNNSRDAAAAVLRRAVHEKGQSGGFVLSNTHELLLCYGATPPHTCEIDPATGTVSVDDVVTATLGPLCERSGQYHLPLRTLGEMMGATIAWDEAQQLAHVRLGSTDVTIIPGSRLAFRNGQAFRLPVPVVVEGDTVLVPLRAMAEALGATVTWERTTSRIGVYWFTPDAAT